MHSTASPSVYATSARTVDSWLRGLYHLTYEGALPASGPFLLLAKHQSLIDIPLIGVPAMRSTGTMPYFIMRPQFCNPLWEFYGGITVIRPQDRNGMPEKEALRKNVLACRSALDALAEGSPLILYPEGTRKYQEMGAISLHDNAILHRILKKMPDVPIVLAGSTYSGRAPGSRIAVRFGEPFRANEPADLEQRIATGIARLSNLPPRKE